MLRRSAPHPPLREVQGTPGSRVTLHHFPPLPPIHISQAAGWRALRPADCCIRIHRALLVPLILASFPCASMIHPLQLGTCVAWASRGINIGACVQNQAPWASQRECTRRCKSAKTKASCKPMRSYGDTARSPTTDNMKCKGDDWQNEVAIQ